MMQPKIALALICKDNSATLPRLLQSVLADPGIDQVFAVDTGSTDGTQDVLTSFGCTWAQAEWEDDYAASRNRALAMVPHGWWVLSLDSDEWVGDGFCKRLLYGVKTLEEGARSEFGVSVWMQNHSDAQGFVNVLPMFAPRLFKNLPGTLWRFPVHEQIYRHPGVSATNWEFWAIASDRTSLPRSEPVNFLQDNQLIVHHSGYLKEEFAKGDKHNRNLRLLRKAVDQDPAEPWFRYNLAEQLYSGGEMKEAEEHYRECIRLNDESGTTNLSAVIYSRMRVVNCLSLRGELKEAETLGEKLAQDHPDYAEGLAALAEVKSKLNAFYHAAQLYERATFIGMRVKSGEVIYPYVGDESIRTWRGAILEARAHARCQEYVRAIECYVKSTEMGCPVLDPIIESSACFAGIGRVDLAMNQLDSVAKISPDNPRAEALRRQITHEQIDAGKRFAASMAGGVSGAVA